MLKNRLNKKVWSKKKYYEIAKEGSLDTKHSGMVLLKKLAENARSILDLGCGEGTRLNFISGDNTKHSVGVDISNIAVSLASKNYPHIKFISENLESLPFKNNIFELTYSAFVLEHLDDPELVVGEAIRVTKPNGNLVLIAPNYGAPNRASPVFKGSRMIKLIAGFLKDVFSIFKKNYELNWLKVQPQTSNYSQDSDTTVEPYIRSLIQYLKSKNMSLETWSSCWEEELPNPSVIQKLFAGLAKYRVYPFTFWGPHLVVHVKKIT